MLRDLVEIWTQNSMAGGTDRLVRGESAVAFETALQDIRTVEVVQTSPFIVEHVNQALNAIQGGEQPETQKN
jgi:hypothetical protein